MIAWLASFLTPHIVGGFIDAYKAKLAAGNDADRIAAELASRELAVQQRELEVTGEHKRALLGRWYEPTNLLGYIMVVYVGKVVIFDKVLETLTAGSTDPIGGQVGEWAGMIIMFLVGKRGLENLALIMRRR